MYFIINSTSKSGPMLVCFVHVDLEMCFASQRRALFFLSTSKSAPRMVCFVRFDFEMCFAPQRRKLFEHLNFQNCSEGNVCFLHFDFELCSRHNGMRFFDMSTSKSAPRMVCFVCFDFEMCFAPQRRALFHLSFGQVAPHPPLWRVYFSTLRPQASEKHSVSRLFYLFARLHLLSSDSFSSLILFLLLISSLL